MVVALYVCGYEVAIVYIVVGVLNIYIVHVQIYTIWSHVQHSLDNIIPSVAG